MRKFPIFYKKMEGTVEMPTFFLLPMRELCFFSLTNETGSGKMGLDEK